MQRVANNKSSKWKRCSKQASGVIKEVVTPAEPLKIAQCKRDILC